MLKFSPKVVFTAFAFILLSPLATAQTSMVVDVGPCVVLQTAVERYTCYERVVNDALNGTSTVQRAPVAPARPVQQAPAPAVQPQVVTQPQASTPPPPTTAVITQPQRPQGEAAFGLEDKAAKKEAVKELRSVIASVETITPNQYKVTLQNGQVWRQTQPNSRMRIEAGQHVRIYPTRWGSDYRMSIEELKGFVQVSRVE